MKKRIIIYSLLVIFLIAGIYYIAIEKKAPFGLSIGTIREDSITKGENEEVRVGEGNYIQGKIIIKVKEEVARILKKDSDLLRGFSNIKELGDILEECKLTEIRHLYPQFTFEVNKEELKKQRRLRQKEKVSITPEQRKAMLKVKEGFRRTFLCTVSEGVNIVAITHKVSALSHIVEYAEPVWIPKIDEKFDPEFKAKPVKKIPLPKAPKYGFPNDTYIDGNTDGEFDNFYGTHGIRDTEVLEVHKIYYKNKKVKEQIIVAVVDSGVDFGHPDLLGKSWMNSNEIDGNGIDDDSNGYIDDKVGPGSYNGIADHIGHGTFVAGIIAANANNKEGILGVNPWAKIMAVKVSLKGDEEGLNGDEGIVYAAYNGAKVINCSWSSGYAYSTYPSLYEAIQYAILPDYDNPLKKECIIVFAAGNDADDVNTVYANNCDKVIAVGNGVYIEDGVYVDAISSNYGKIDLLAPGTDILSLVSSDTSKAKYPPVPVDDMGLYGLWSGTSFSAPFVSGVVSLLCGIEPSMNTEKARQILHLSSKDLVDGDTFFKGFDDASGYGLLNARDAVKFLLAHPKDIVPLTLDIGLLPGYFIDKAEKDEDFNVVVFTNLPANFDPKNIILEYGLGVKYGYGTIPDKWIPLKFLWAGSAGITPFSADIKDGVYTFRVRTAVPNEKGRYYEAFKRITINKMDILSPTQDKICHPNTKIEVIGMIEGKTLKNYEIQIGKGENPVSYNTISEDTGPVPYGTLGEIDLTKSGFINEGKFTIRLLGHYAGYDDFETRTIQIVSSILDGWPQETSQIAGYGVCDKTVGDIDGDGDKEIILPFRYAGSAGFYSDPKLFIYNPNGDIVKEYEMTKTSEGILGNNCFYIDINSDEIKDLVFLTQDDIGEIRLYSLINYEMELLDSFEWNSSLHYYHKYTGYNIVFNTAKIDNRLLFSLKDIMNLYDKEVNFLSSYSAIGNILTYGIFSYIKDNKYKTGIYIITEDINTKTYYISAYDEEFMFLWEQELFSGDTNKILAGDLDNDGNDEIIIDLKQPKTDEYGLTIFRHDGSIYMDSDPRNLGASDETGMFCIVDLDKDKNPEIVGFYNHGLTIVDSKGGLKEKVELDDMLGDKFAQGPSFYCSSIVVGDYNGDSVPDIITTGLYEKKYELRVFYKSYNYWHSKVLLQSRYEEFHDPVLSDINNDGKTEIVVTGVRIKPFKPLNIYVLKTQGASSDIGCAMARYNNQKTGRYTK